jgi:hypothetical protein
MYAVVRFYGSGSFVAAALAAEEYFAAVGGPLNYFPLHIAVMSRVVVEPPASLDYVTHGMGGTVLPANLDRAIRLDYFDLNAIIPRAAAVSPRHLMIEGGVGQI